VESIAHGNQAFLLVSPETLPSPLLLASQCSWAGLSGMRHLRDGLRIRLGDDAPGATAGGAFRRAGWVDESQITHR